MKNLSNQTADNIIQKSPFFILTFLLLGKLTGLINYSCNASGYMSWDCMFYDIIPIVLLGLLLSYAFIFLIATLWSYRKNKKRRINVVAFLVLLIALFTTNFMHFGPAW